MKKQIFEILVDRENEKWPWVFEHILIVLHEVFDEKKFKDNRIDFSFEITKIAWRIRFFIVAPVKYISFLKNQIYAHFNDVEIIDVGDYLAKIPDDKILVWKITQAKHYLFPIKTFTQIQENWTNTIVDPYSSITSALDKAWVYSVNTLQINFSALQDKFWKKNVKQDLKLINSKYPKFVKKILLEDWDIILKMLVYSFIIFPVFVFSSILSSIFKKKDKPEINEKNKENEAEDQENLKDLWLEKEDEIPKVILEKISKPAYKVSINILSASKDYFTSKATIREISSTLGIFSWVGLNKFYLKEITNDFLKVDEAKSRIIWDDNFVLNTEELSWLVHLPTNYVKTPGINWVSARKFEPPSNLPIIDPDLSDNITPETDLTPIWKTNFRWTNMSFWIWPNDRRRHIYVIWKTWMGKSTLLENMIIDDIKKGRWVAVIDPHWDLAEAIIWHIPKNRTNHTIIFDPSDTDFPIAFNMLEQVPQEHRSFVASWLVGIFKKIFGDSWWPRLEHILRNTILALLEYPDSTLISIPMMLTSEVFRNKVVSNISDPVVKKFWTHEFAKMSATQKVEASWPILNKVWQFLSSTILRNILGQAKNTFNIRWAMDNRKIIVINLSKWKIWEDASALLWAMMVTKFQMDAMSRADMAEKDRKDFYLYVDEFQNFATDSFATILSEARKYKLNLVMANQYIDQMQETVKWAVFGNVWSLISFQVGYHDASILKDVLWSPISENDLTSLAKYKIYLKELIDWMPSPIFSADTFPPYPKNPVEFEARYKKILKVSREKYAKPRQKVEEQINKTIAKIEAQEKYFQEKKQIQKQKK